MMNFSTGRFYQKGASLQEVLVAIAVFIVGILALARLFPQGQRLITNAKNNSIANQLVKAQISDLKSYPEEIPEQIIHHVIEKKGVGSRLSLHQNTSNDPGFFAFKSSEKNHITRTGKVILKSKETNKSWLEIGGINQLTWIIGEGKKIPAPTNIGTKTKSEFGSLVHLRFAPIRNHQDAKNLNVYSSSLPFGGDNPDQSIIKKENKFYFKDDQIYFPQGDYENIFLKFNFNYGTKNNTRIYSAILSAPTSNLDTYEDLFLIDVIDTLKKNFNTPENELGEIFAENNYQNIDLQSVKLSPRCTRINHNQNFSPGQPYQYKLIGGARGSILLHPELCREESIIKFDYPVLDWRILKEDFYLSNPQKTAYSLRVNGLKQKNSPQADQLPSNGMPLGTPQAENDFILMDLKTGGYLERKTSYKINHSKGILQLNNKGTIVLPMKLGKLTNIELKNREFRAFYQKRGEWALSFRKTADHYTLLRQFPAKGLVTGNCYIGGLDSGKGIIGRIYFPHSDVNNYVRVASNHIDQNFRIQPSSDSLGYPYIELGKLISASNTKIIGVTLTSKVQWNPEYIKLSSNPQKNYRTIEDWSRNFRSISSQILMNPGGNS